MNAETKKILRWIALFVMTAQAAISPSSTHEGWWGFYRDTATGLAVIVNMYASIRLMIWFVHDSFTT